MIKKRVKHKSNYKRNTSNYKKVEKQCKQLNGKQKKILYLICLIAMIIAFVSVWSNIYLTSQKFEKQMDKMVLGRDYYREGVVITNKKAESGSSNYNLSSTENYFFYYKGGQRMEVSKKIYDQYRVGNSISAYTTNHIRYSYYKYGILPDNAYRNNELLKCLGVLLGGGIALLTLIGFLSRDEFNRKN